MKRYLFFCILFTFSVLPSEAQTRSEFELGLAVPQGKFAGDNEGRAIFRGHGMARTGFYMGYKLLSPLAYEGFYWIFNAGIMYNDLQRDYKDDMEDGLDDYDGDYSLPKYVNIPILTGVQYERSLSDGFQLFGNMGLGVNILKITNLAASDDYHEELMTFAPSPGFASTIGGGLRFKDKYSLGLAYTGLGAHKVKYKMKWWYDGDTESDRDRFDRALPVSVLRLTFGIQF